MGFRRSRPMILQLPQLQELALARVHPRLGNCVQARSRGHLPDMRELEEQLMWAGREFERPTYTVGAVEDEHALDVAAVDLRGKCLRCADPTHRVAAAYTLRQSGVYSATILACRR